MSHAEALPGGTTPTGPPEADVALRYGQESVSEPRPLVPGCRCGAAWPGNTVCHCSKDGCHITFTNAANFDRHRRNGRCLDMAEAGLELKDRAGYVVWGAPNDGYDWNRGGGAA